ncbi:hypothetical protein TIFTF001_015257 [Ficus carica]|uniref:Uncharacterized protein n=1 Tax=Ficus carica TaxID=3494 RepID=A0AA88AHG8_FICCA|nr:hypothetical protein TIFTF001_015257 [Ficus carica]
MINLHRCNILIAAAAASGRSVVREDGVAASHNDWIMREIQTGAILKRHKTFGIFAVNRSRDGDINDRIRCLFKRVEFSPREEDPQFHCRDLRLSSSPSRGSLAILVVDHGRRRSVWEWQF